jgi:parallel beta-helix repeat protein
MKNNPFFFFLIFISSFSIVCAQEIRDAEGWTVTPINVNGLRLLGKYTKAEVIATLGTPSSYVDTVYLDSENPEDTFQMFDYSSHDNICLENGRFMGLYLVDSASNLLINNIVGVGYPISAVETLKNQLGSSTGDIEYKTLTADKLYIRYCLSPNGDSYIRFHYNSTTNKITKIIFSTID